MFGARPSGSKVLEEAIDHMIDLALENGLNDITTENVNVSSLLLLIILMESFLGVIYMFIACNYRYHIGYEERNQL